MSNTHFSSSGYYRIEVEGILPASCCNRLGAMQILPPSHQLKLKKTNDGIDEITMMQGKVSDQADLSGILNSLYELHLPLLSVQFIGNKMPLNDKNI